MIEQLTAVLAVLLLLSGTLWWLRRRGIAVFGTREHPKRSLEHLERMSLGPQHTLYLLRFDDTDLLVSASPTGCALVHSRPHKAPEAGR